MTNQHTLEALELTDADTALRFHLQSRHYPPVHLDFLPVIKEAIQAANRSEWNSTLKLPNGAVLSVAEIVEKLHLDPFLESVDEDWEPLPTRTVCVECSDDGEPFEGITTHCERCGKRVWS